MTRSFVSNTLAATALLVLLAHRAKGEIILGGGENTALAGVGGGEDRRALLHAADLAAYEDDLWLYEPEERPEEVAAVAEAQAALLLKARISAGFQNNDAAPPPLAA